MTTPDLASTALLVPVKAFGQAKRRLAAVLDPDARARLARSMASTVVAAAGGLPVAVVCDDTEVADWARSLGIDVVWTPACGLNRAVSTGVGRLAESGADQVIVAHADLPLARDLSIVAGRTGVTIVPDAADDGTNVICIPSRSGFVFAYGPGSFGRHRAEARRLGLVTTVLRHPSLVHDVDRPVDLAAAGMGGWSR